MSSGSKFPRGTGRGQFRPPQNRGLLPLRHGPASSKKTSLGQGRDAIGSLCAGNGGSGSAREESFQLLAHPSTMGRPFAMLIRLQPEILEELKQAEADGIQASMKFGANATGHVIQVGSKSFKFSSAPEPGDLCDIYEQKQGESGEAVLVESGSAWRKLSVQRILSATEKDRVKKRTAEAEHRQKQRKSILVDPSTQMIIPQAGTADANGRKPAPKVSKEPPPKKRRVTASPTKPRPQITTVPGNRQFASPASPSFDPPVASVRGNQMNQMSDSHLSKGRAGSERVVGPSPSIPKEKPRTSAASAVPETAKSGSATNLTDLRNFLIGLLQENPKGVSIKAIEKAVAESLSGVADKRALDKVMKSIASFHAPGKYLLNAGVEKGSYLEPVPPTSSGRAQEAVRPTTHEADPLNGIVEKEAAKDKEEPSSYDRPLSVVSHYDIKEASPKHKGNSNVSNEDLTKQEAAHATKDPSNAGSESSSSSGSGSGSDSDSDSSGSGSGTDSGSGSGSGSDSDSSSSSSAASMDEDVDIMSDDDVEKGKLDAKQKVKGRESKPLTKEDIRTHENNILEEGRNFNQDNPVATLDQANATRPDTLAKASDNIIEAVFGTDEPNNFGEDSGEHTRGEYSRQEKAAKSQYGERKAPAKAHISKDSRDRCNFEEPQENSAQDNKALGIEEKLDILVEKISEANMEVGGGNRGGLFSSQQEHHKPLLKSGGPGPGKDNDKRRADTEYIGSSNLDRKERGAYPSSDGRSALKNRSLEVHSSLHEGSPMDMEERLQNIASSERLSQAGAEARKTGSKKSATKETRERFERAKAPEVVKGRSPSNVARSTQGSSNAFEAAWKLDDERIGRLSDRGGAETSDFLEMKQRKGKVLEDNMVDATKTGDISGRQSRDFETQHLQQKDVAAPSKGSAHRVSRDSNHLSGAHDRDSPHLHKSKVTKHSRQKGESLDRAGLVVELAERPIEDSDSTRRGKDVYGKGALKEAEPGGRLSSVEPSNVVAKETARFGESGQSHGRSNVRENCRTVSQPAELRDPPFENGTLDSRKWLTPMEDSRSKATSSTINRLPYKGSSSPDQDDLQPLDRRALELPKLSPVRTFDDSRYHAYDSRSAKRRHEESENTEMERSKRRGGAGQVKQPHHKEEWFQGGPVKKNHIEKGRFSASDSQEYAGTSKFSALENSVRSDEELDESYRQQRASHTRAASSDLRRDNLKAGDSLDNSKRLSPHSADEIDGSEFFAPYEKKEADLRGLINTFHEYKEYCKEYREKYPVYIKLNGVIEHNKKPFESLRKDMERARCKDDEKKIAHTCAKVRREYALHHKVKSSAVVRFSHIRNEIAILILSSPIFSHHLSFLNF
ncbi:hypothetical protein GOP47_0024470 [Adiantum capillus-veneris]|uniref:OCEL domain-containing protein n=1 Tax=Adiantum capillus-veneris TaxID=13818 RepID=A0A9D4U277_ADICA|nr:hypothetical protein GOP47_0024470 [Adiantum capillus-veneris]